MYIIAGEKILLENEKKIAKKNPRVSD